jgi:hypothetical protein
MNIPQRQLPLPLLQNSPLSSLPIILKPPQNFLLAQFRQQLGDIIVKTDQTPLNDQHSRKSSKQLRLRSEQKHRIILDVFGIAGVGLVDGGFAYGVGVLEGTWKERDVSPAFGWREEILEVRFLGIPSAFVAKTTACGILPSCTAAARFCSKEVAAAISSSLYQVLC